jgi:hypothetical protein
VKNALREKLEARAFPSLDAMMDGYARAAADLARASFHRSLDFTPDSIDPLDEILVLLSDTPDIDLDFESRLWGSYLGEILRRRYSGAWEMTPYPGGVAAIPAIDVRGSRLFPLMKVYRRLTIGEEEDMRSFYALVTARLGDPSRVN